MLKISLVVFLILVAKCSSYEWKSGINSDKSFDFDNQEFTKNLENLLNYNGYENSDFNKNNKMFNNLLKSIGYEIEDQFDVNFDPWNDDNHGNQNSEISGENPDENEVPLMYRRALKNTQRMYKHVDKEILLSILKTSKIWFNHFNREMF